MPSLLIKDLSVAAHKQLRERAKANHRSMQKEAALLLNTFLAAEPVAEFHDQFIMVDPPTAAELVQDLKSGRR